MKEARSKCRTIASLLTDAPNPHSKGVLMFKKRRQRAKKYTLTCFGSVDTDRCSNTDGETEDESIFLGSESEIDEDNLSTAPDPTWDSGYLDVLERRTSAYVLSDGEADGSLGLSDTSGRGAELFEQQRKKAEKHIPTPITPTANPMPQQQSDTMLTYTSIMPVTPISSHNTNMVNGDPVVVSRTSVVLSSPSQTSMPTMSGAFPEQSDACSGSSVMNRTARPFAPGCVSHRAATAPVIFKLKQYLWQQYQLPSLLMALMGKEQLPVRPCTSPQGHPLSVFPPLSCLRPPLWPLLHFLLLLQMVYLSYHRVQVLLLITPLQLPLLHQL